MASNPSSLNEGRIRKALAAHTPVTLGQPGLVRAAVLIPLLRGPEGLRVLLTVRTAHVEHHKGEVSFPGGAHDSEDATLEETALRETQEEVGIRPADVELAGRLSDYRTPSGFAVTPFVGFLPFPYPYAPSWLEVAELLEAPLAELWEACCQGPRPVSRGGRMVLAYEYFPGGHRVFGATARMLTDLLGLLGAPVVPPQSQPAPPRP